MYLYTTTDDALTASTGVGGTNACWTAMMAIYSSTDTYRALMGGYTGSPISCVKHAVDGYSLMGA